MPHIVREVYLRALEFLPAEFGRRNVEPHIWQIFYHYINLT